MKTSRFIVITGCILLMISFIPGAAASSVTPAYDTYSYSYDGNPVSSPAAYIPTALSDLSGQLSGPSDLTAGPDGRLYIADTGNNRIVITDSSLQPVAEIAAFADPKGNETALSAPQGVFVTEDGRLYVADTGGGRIVIFRPERAGFVCESIIGRPQDKLLPESFVFAPVALAADKLGRLYVLSNNTTMGIMSFDNAHRFEGFFGQQKVLPSGLFWLRRLLMTEEQRNRILQSVPTTYSNITVDSDNFVFVSNKSIALGHIVGAVQMRSKDSALAVVKRLNPGGDDILLRNGAFPPVGDVSIPLGRVDDYGASEIGDVAVRESGCYTLLDVKRNKFFTYSDQGELLYAFGGTGARLGQYQQAVSIAYDGSDLLVLDKKTGFVTRLSLTPYGEILDRAILLEKEKRYDESVELWSGIIEANHNLDMAYARLAAAYYRAGEYQKAQQLYKSGHDVNGYSKAFEQRRNAFVDRWFLLIPLSAGILITAVALLLRKVNAINRRTALQQGGYTLSERIAYNFQVFGHPFDSFYDIKRYGHGDLLSAVLLLILCMISVAGGMVTKGYIARDGQESVALGTGLVVVLVPVILFTTANWCLTCLMNGEGSFKNIFITTCYSLLPLTLTALPLGLLSNLVGQSDLALMNTLSTLSVIITVFLLYCGTLTIHNYGVAKNIAVMLLTAVGMIILTFIATLLLELAQQIAGLASDLWQEILLRF